MYQEKEALQYLVNLGETKILTVGGKDYSTNQIFRVTDPIPAALVVTTLSALVDYIKTGLDKKCSSNLLVHVKSPKEVLLYSELRGDAERETYMQCKALLPDNTQFDRFMNAEQFNIMLQSSFVQNEDRDILLKVTGCIQDKAVKEVGDDGVSQAVVMKTGVAQVENVKVPNPVVLAPFRTFQEIRQPESKFIFRMQSGPCAALFEADGGAWRNDAMNLIKEYLEDELTGVENIKVIS